MAKPRLNQAIASLKGTKKRVYDELTTQHQRLQKPALFNGIVKTYEPTTPEGETFPQEKGAINFRVDDILKDLRKGLAEYYDKTLTVDVGNTQVRANVEVGGVVLLRDVPVPTLLFLEKQLVDLYTLVSKLPTLDTAEEWEFNAAQGTYSTQPTQQHRTKKLTKFLTVAKATTEHPEQIREVTEDVVVGYWRTIKYSAAVSPTKVREWQEKIQKLLAAVKSAREEANSNTIEECKMGDSLLSFIFE